jgi:hypothetical protein
MQAVIVAMTISLSAVGCHHGGCYHGRSHGCYGGGYRGACYSSCYSGCYGGWYGGASHGCYGGGYAGSYAQPVSYAPSYYRAGVPSGQRMSYAPVYGSPVQSMYYAPAYGSPIQTTTSAPVYGTPAPMTSTPVYGTTVPSTYSSAYGPPATGTNAGGSIGREFPPPSAAGVRTQGTGVPAVVNPPARAAQPSIPAPTVPRPNP